MTETGQPALLPALAVAIVVVLVSTSCDKPEAAAPTVTTPEPPVTTPEPPVTTPEPPAIHLDRTSREVHEAKLEPGDGQGYEIRLEYGEYLVLRVDQLSVDLRVVFRDPEGQRQFDVDNTNSADGAYGPEIVHWVARTDGIHRAELRALPDEKTGSYTLTVKELRPATPRDRIRVKAEEALARGDALERRQALAEYEYALAELRDLGETSRQADALVRLAEARNNLGEKTAAIPLYDEALQLYETIGNNRKLALTLYSSTRARCTDYEPEPCLADLERVLALWRHVGDRVGQATALSDLGLTHRILGNGSDARDAYDQAIALYRELGLRQQLAIVLVNRGRLLGFLGLRERAIDDLTAALEIRRELGENIPRILNALGMAHLVQGHAEKALAHFQQAWEALESPDPREGLERSREKTRAISLAGSGRSQLDLGSPEEGMEDLRTALDLFLSLNDEAWQAWTLGRIGLAWSMMDAPRRAREKFEEALELSRSIQADDGVAETLRLMARAERRQGALLEALGLIKDALQQVEDLRIRTSTDPDLRATYLSTKQSYYDLLVGLLMDLDHLDPTAGFAAEALEASERARARSLLEILERRYGQQRDAAPASGAQRVLSAAATLSATEIRRFLDPETLLLEYKLVEDQSYLWAVTASSLEVFRLPARGAIEADVRRAYELIVENSRLSRVRREILLADLSQMLLGPLGQRLDGMKRLVIVADGALDVFPFAALPVPGAPANTLADRHEIVYLPSASILAVLREQTVGRRPAPGQLAVVADPVFGFDDPRLADGAPPADGASRTAERPAPTYPRLVYSGEEAATLLDLVPPSSQFPALGFDANRDALPTLGHYRIVHFATHGEIDTEEPGLSRLVLSLVDENARARDDGLLYAHQIYDLELPVELVVLSACRTALGKTIRGEGLVGLTRSFMHAGAPRVIVSLWDVDDEPTAALMTHLYRRLLTDKATPAAALRSAQVEIRSRPHWRDPRHWAGFVLQGDWHDIARDDDK